VGDRVAVDDRTVVADGHVQVLGRVVLIDRGVGLAAIAPDRGLSRAASAPGEEDRDPREHP
jgi:hypothetical protein